MPNGHAAGDGAYVHYRADEQYALLTIEAARAGARVVGENLGTVPPETNRALRRHGILGMYVVPFELHPGGEPPLRRPGTRELACLDTHDTATFAAYWRDLDVESRDAMIALLRDARLLAATCDTPPPIDVLGALLAYLGSTRAELVLATLEDLWLEPEAQNAPGVPAAERPNFRRRAARSLDEIEASGVESGLLGRLDEARRGTRRRRATLARGGTK